MAFEWCCLGGEGPWWGNLPDDVRVDILCRLPEKVLIQFKSVSKSWYSLISNLCVPKISPPASSVSLSGIIYQDSNSMGYIPCTNAETGPGFMESVSAIAPFPKVVQDCCNGLVLLVKKFVVPIQYYVCNPATKQCIGIPINSSHRNMMFAALDFDPRDSLTYKIVRVDESPLTATVDYPPKLHIFSSDTGKWVSLVMPLDPKLYAIRWYDDSICLKGVLYGLSAARVLICIDLTKVHGRAIELPDDDRVCSIGNIGVSSGCFYYSNQDGSLMLIWLLEYQSGKWELKHRIPIDNVTRGGRFINKFWVSGAFRASAFHPTSPLIFIATPLMFFSYHLQTHRMQVLGREYDGTSPALALNYFPYTRCLHTLKQFSSHTSDHSNLCVGHSLGTGAGEYRRRMEGLSDVVERISIAQAEAAQRDKTIICMLSAAADHSQMLMDQMTKLEILVRSSLGTTGAGDGHES